MTERKSGLILNVSSTSSAERISFGLFSVYAATKAYNRKLSQCIAEECEGTGVEVLCVVPGFVTSAMTKTRRRSSFVCTEQEIARKSLETVGHNYVVINPWIMHRIMELILTFGGSYIKKYKYKTSLKLRSLALRKKAEKDKEKDQ